MTPEQFYKFTVKQFLEYLKQYTEKRKIENEEKDWRTARICATIANFNRTSKKQKKYTEKNFMPEVKKEIKEKKKMSINHMASVLEAITLAFGGTINK